MSRLWLLVLLWGCTETVTVEVPVEVPTPTPRVTMNPILIYSGTGNDFLYVYGTAKDDTDRYGVITEVRGYGSYLDFKAGTNPRFTGTGGIGFFSDERIRRQETHLGLDSLQTTTMKAGVLYHHYVRGQTFEWQGENVWYDWRITVSGVSGKKSEGVVYGRAK